MERSGYGRDGIYRSLRPPLKLPTNPNLSMVSFLFRNISSYPHHPALIDSTSGQTLSFSTLKSTVAKLSHGLITQLGLKQGDVVLILAPNSIQYPVTFLSVIATGAIATTVNPIYTLNEIKKQAQDCKPNVIVCVPELWDKVKDFNLPTLVLGPKGNGKIESSSKIVFFDDLVSGSVGDLSLPKVDIKQSDTAALLYSSGTTGVSKGVVLTHGNFIATSLQYCSDQDFENEGHNVFLCVIPIFHVFGLAVILVSQLQRGNAVVVVEKFDFEGMLGAIEKYRVTHLLVVPPIMLGLAKDGRVRKYDLSSLKLLASGGAPLGKEIMVECAKNVPQASVMQGYGLTETCGIISLEHPRLGSRHSGSAGMLLPSVEARIVKVDTSEPLPPKKLGEIWVRGPNMMKGYLNNPQATKMTIDDQGWVHTGDLGYIDEEGQIFVVDRLKELIKYKGFQVAPAELEAILTSHPQILEAAVIPFPDPKAGEVPVAYVVRSPQSTLKEEDVMKFVSDQVAPYKRLRKVVFCDSIPKAPSGKLLRRVLLQQAQSKSKL